MDKREKATELFKSGYNCAQSVVISFEDEIGKSREELAKLSYCLGGGIGRLREVCGAVSGMALVLGMLEAEDRPGDDAFKKEMYAKTQKLAFAFKEKHGTIICRELLGISDEHSDPTPDARTPQYFASRPCPDIIGDAAEILEEYFAGKLNI